jgi:hypothetical protein
VDHAACRECGEDANFACDVDMFQHFSQYHGALGPFVEPIDAAPHIQPPSAPDLKMAVTADRYLVRNPRYDDVLACSST